MMLVRVLWHSPEGQRVKSTLLHWHNLTVLFRFNDREPYPSRASHAVMLSDR